MGAGDRKRRLIIVAVVVTVSLTSVFAGMAWRQLIIESQEPTENINYLLSFQDSWKVLNSNSVPVEDWSNSVVLLNFWGSWCKPCVEEMPLLNQFDADHDAINIVGIVVDQEQAAEQFLSKLEISFPSVLLDQSVVTDLLHRYGNSDMVLPYSVAFGQSGEQIFTKLGPLEERELRRLIE